jgi:hypothetical protein
VRLAAGNVRFRGRRRIVVERWSLLDVAGGKGSGEKEECQKSHDAGSFRGLTIVPKLVPQLFASYCTCGRNTMPRRRMSTILSFRIWARERNRKTAPARSRDRGTPFGTFAK